MIQDPQHVCATCGKACEHLTEPPQFAIWLMGFVLLIGVVSIVQWIADMNRGKR